MQTGWPAAGAPYGPEVAAGGQARAGGGLQAKAPLTPREGAWAER